MKSGITVCRFLVCLGLSTAGTSQSRPALAIEKYRTITLPDGGLSSSVQATTNNGAGRYGVAGWTADNSGARSAHYWGVRVAAGDVNGDSVDFTSHTLPAADGLSSEASDVAFLGGDPDRPVIVGSVFGQPGISHPAIWRKVAGGQFTGAILDDHIGVATGVATKMTPNGLIIVVCGRYQLDNGDTHACFYVGSANGGVWRLHDLGTAGGHNSSAADGDGLVDAADYLLWRVVGSSQTANGRTVAAVWEVHLMEEEGIFYFVRTLPTPPSAESSALSISDAANGAFAVTGSVTGQNGRSHGAVWMQAVDGTSNTIMISELAGYRSSQARGIIFNGRDGDDQMVVGTAWNTETDRRAFGDLVGHPKFDDPFQLDSLRTETVDNNETITVHGVCTSPGGTIGVNLGHGADTVTHAAILIPGRIDVPNIIGVLIGLLVDKDAGNLSGIYSRDGSDLRFAPRKEQAPRSIALEFGFRPLSPPSDRRMPGTISFGGTIAAKKSAEVQSLSFVTQVYRDDIKEWVVVDQVVASIVSSQDYFQRTVTVPDPERFLLPYVEQSSLRVRMIVTKQGGEPINDWSFALDYMELENIYLP